MSNLILRKSRYSPGKIHLSHTCPSDNITIVSKCQINDTVSYRLSQCNYCGKEWNESWLSYGDMFSSLIYQQQNKATGKN
jgi:hypothetical protein